MIPLKDENPTKTFPFVTIAIIIANVLVFIYELNLGEGLQDKISQFAVIPYNITHLTEPAALLTLVTSLFFHGGFAHIFGNMLYFWVFGNNIEDRLGHLRFIFFYILGGILATFGHILIAPDSKIPLIGASGAISAVLGAYVILYPRAKVLVLIPFFFLWRIVRIQAWWFLIFWIILQLFYGTASLASAQGAEMTGVAWFAHVGGFLAGILLLFFFLKRKKKKDKKEDL
ncbi:MAG: rhomboid family intramembrane serine protease [Candidatus Omnitrophota bacterium]|nr:MAG: rhomboid family intramembrane serine protease [Candidatus Omnitrophota bacterium]